MKGNSIVVNQCEVCQCISFLGALYLKNFKAIIAHAPPISMLMNPPVTGRWNARRPPPVFLPQSSSWAAISHGSLHGSFFSYLFYSFLSTVDRTACALSWKSGHVLYTQDCSKALVQQAGILDSLQEWVDIEGESISVVNMETATRPDINQNNVYKIKA